MRNGSNYSGFHGKWNHQCFSPLSFMYKVKAENLFQYKIVPD